MKAAESLAIGKRPRGGGATRLAAARNAAPFARETLIPAHQTPTGCRYVVGQVSPSAARATAGGWEYCNLPRAEEAARPGRPDLAHYCAAHRAECGGPSAYPLLARMSLRAGGVR